MKVWPRVGFALVIMIVAASLSTTFAADLSFEGRVRAQEAIERVYYAHQIGATRPFDVAVPRDLLERKVRSYMGLSAALEVVWNRPLSAQDLNDELQRILKQTRIPGRLAEVFAALDHDAVLLQECYVRPVLLQRLVKDQFSIDPRPVKTWSQWWPAVEPLVRGREVPAVADAVELPAWLDRPGTSPGQVGSCRTADAWDEGLRYDVPGPRWDHSAVWTGSLMIIWGGLQGLEEKPTFTGARYDPTTDTWTPTSLIGAPHVYEHTAIWSGKEMIVWGGGSGARYDPLTDTWRPMSAQLAPITWNGGHTAVWTGQVMVTWGGGICVPHTGGCDPDVTSAGGRYDPATDTWSPTSMTGAPSPRSGHGAVWTGSEMIVWGGWGGGGSTTLGGAYDPVADTWREIISEGSPSPRRSPLLAWDGREVIVVGGLDLAWKGLKTGGRYDPAGDAWRSLPEAPFASSAYGNTLLATGRELIIWRGHDGARFDSTSSTWTLLAGPQALNGFVSHTAVWTGSEMIVWGGGHARGGRYDPAHDTWRITAGIDPPPYIGSASAVWTGNLMVTFGGYDGDSFFSSGGRYDPIVDAWMPVSQDRQPPGRTTETVYWTGDTMLIWGGGSKAGGEQADGARYDPIQDTWIPMSAAGGPQECWGNSAFADGSLILQCWNGALHKYDTRTDTWSGVSLAGAPVIPSLSLLSTGSEILAWSRTAQGAGALYDPRADSWRPMSTAGQPPAGGYHAQWAGRRMIVWGVAAGGEPAAARYDPLTDTWSPASAAGAPAGSGSGVWTGSSLIVWSGNAEGSARYDPAADTWQPVTRTGAPPGYSKAVWAGDRMLVWGMSPLNCGGRYYLANAHDADADGFLDCTDCDDLNAATHPGAIDLPGNALDENCDGTATCDPASFGQRHGRYVSCVMHACRDLAAAGAMDRQQCQAVVSNPGESRAPHR